MGTLLRREAHEAVRANRSRVCRNLIADELVISEHGVVRDEMPVFHVQRLRTPQNRSTESWFAGNNSRAIIPFTCGLSLALKRARWDLPVATSRLVGVEIAPRSSVLCITCGKLPHLRLISAV